MWNRIKYKLRRAGYICFLIAAIFAFLYFRSRTSLIFLFIMIVLPVCSYILAVNQKDVLEISVKAAGRKIYDGDTAHFIIRLNNPHPFPVMKVNMDINISNAFMGNKGVLPAVIGAAGKEDAILQLPFAVDDIGIVCVSVSNIMLFDFFGIFSFKLSVNEHADARVLVMPKVRQESEKFYNSFRVGFLESEENAMKGSDFSEVSDLREYIPGDRLKDIHWKASAKRQEIMVKERVSLSQSQLVLVPDITDDRQARRMVIEKVCAVCLGLFARETAVMLLWGSRQNGYASESICSVSEMEIGIEKIFMEEEYISGIDAFKMYKGRHPMLESCLLASAGEDGAEVRVLEG